MRIGFLKVAVLTIGLTTGIGLTQADAASYHQIKKGDTLYSLAKEYETTVDQLKHLNNLKNNTIYAGKKLEVPTTLTVKKGDTLYSISKKYGLTVKELKSLNGLKSNLIKVGQKLTVNKAASESYDANKIKVELTVKKGYTFDAEEPGKYILQYAKDGSYFTRIEVLDAKTNVEDVKKNSVDYLKAIGKVTDIPTTNVNPFYKGAHFFLHANNNKAQSNIVVKKVDGKLVKFTIHYLNKEESEGIIPYMIEILQSTKLK